ncbi:MAG: NAD(P)-dependent oxidoreductase [Chitinophagaceae bacterium]
MRKILVTGATGFIGNYIVNNLLQQNYLVIASSSNRNKAENAEWFSSVKYFRFDLKEFNDTINYYEYFERPDAVIHLAWEGLPNYKSSFHIEENLPRHYFFLKNLVEHGLTNLTITGTCFEYGMQEGCLSEDMFVMPGNAYAQAKNSLREQLMLLQSGYNFDLKWVRLFYMYGKGQNPNSLFQQLEMAVERGDAVFNMSAGDQVRDYLPVEKVADNIVKISLQTEVTGVINCCSGLPVTVKEMVNKYLEEKQKTISLNLGYYPYPDFEPMAFWGDRTRLDTVKKI